MESSPFFKLEARDHTSMLCSALLGQQWDGDLLLAVGDVGVRAHSALLRCVSPKLTDLLATVSSCSSCRSTSVIHFDETSPAGLWAFIHLLYKGEVNKPLNQVLEAYDIAKVFGLNVSIERKQSSSRLEENDGGTAEKERAAGNCLKKTNGEDRKRRNVNSPAGNDDKRKCGGSRTAEESKGVDGNISQVEGTGQEDSSTGEGDESREEFEDERNRAQGRSSVEQDEASVETVEFAVVDQEGQGRILEKQGGHAIIDLTGDHGMEEAQKELAVTSGIKVNNSQDKDGNAVLQVDPRYKFCDSCMKRRREIPCYKCYKLCDVCVQFKRKKWFHRLRGDEGIMRVCDSCRKNTREEIEAQSRTEDHEVPVRRSLRKSAQESTADGFYTDHCFSWSGEKIYPVSYSRLHCGICNFAITDLLMAAAPEMDKELGFELRTPKDYLFKHIRERHVESGEGHACDQCKFATTCGQSSLNSHIERIHLGKGGGSKDNNQGGKVI